MWKQPFWLRVEAQRRTFNAAYALHLSRQLPACWEAGTDSLSLQNSMGVELLAEHDIKGAPDVSANDPYMSIAGLFGFTTLPAAYIGYVAGATGTYLILVEIVKRSILRRHLTEK